MTPSLLSRLFLAAASTALITACSNEARVSFDSVAGAELDTGNFGNSTMNNQLVMSGQSLGAVDLNRRFAAEVPSMINFAFDSAQLDAQARAALDQQAAWIKRVPGVRFRVYGHTDAVGTEAYNRRLGERRAIAAVRYLIGRGISRDRLEAVASFGETQPLVVTEGEERRNRRTVTEVSGFQQGHPMVHDGKYMLFAYQETITSATELHDRGSGTGTE